MIYVPDASRAVGVCSNLLSDTLRDAYVQEVADDYAKAAPSLKAVAKPNCCRLPTPANNATASTGPYTPPTPMAGRAPL